MQIKETKLKMSSLQTYLVARAFDESIKRFYACPENEKRFLEWQKSNKSTQKEEKRNEAD